MQLLNLVRLNFSVINKRSARDQIMESQHDNTIKTTVGPFRGESHGQGTKFFKGVIV